MCYDDNGPAGPPMTLPCAEPADANIFDCGHDDYFHTAPAANSYLATHWNTARSDWIVGGEGATTVSLPVPGLPAVSLLPGQSMTTTALGRVSWAPPADVSGIAAYQVQRRKERAAGQTSLLRAHSPLKQR